MSETISIANLPTGTPTTDDILVFVDRADGVTKRANQSEFPATAGDVTKVGTPVNNQVGVWTGDGTIEGDAALTFDTTTDTLTTGTVNSTSLTASQLTATDGSKNIVSLAVATYPSLTEISYVKGVTSAIQTQINAKAPSASPTFTGTVTVPTPSNGTDASNKDYSDTLNPDFYQYSIVRTVDGSGNLTVALKNYEGNDPTPTKPVKIMIGGVVRTITSALSCILYPGANALNLGSAELATKEVDLFGHLYWYDTATPARVGLCVSRTPIITDMSASYLSEKGVYIDYDGSHTPSATTPVVNIGRFNATLSAGGAYTWSIPATSVIVNRPIYENQKQKNQLIVGEGINQSASYTTSVTMDFSSFTEYDITAQAGALLFNNPSGTPVNGQKRMVRIKDNGTARALTYGSQFASGSATLPTTTTLSKKLWIGFEWDSTDSKWYCLATGVQP